MPKRAPTEADRAEFEVLLKMVDELPMKIKRQIFSSMRNGATPDAFIPGIGMTYGQVNTFLVLLDKS